MYNAHTELVAALSTILPTYYELFLNGDCSIPCISYMGRNNSVKAYGDTVGYSNISYQIKIWANDLADIQTYAASVDDKLRTMGFTRTNSTELFDPKSTMIQKIMTYEALAKEEFSATNN